MDEPTTPAPQAEAAPPAAAAHKRPGGLRAARVQKDRSMLGLVGMGLIVVAVVVSFTISLVVSFRPKIVQGPPPDYEPLDKLVTGVVETAEDGTSAITYDFASYAGPEKRKDLDRLLADWKGGRYDRDATSRLGRRHMNIRLDAKSGLPLTPLLSSVSFQHDLKLSVTLEPTRACDLLIFFHYFYDSETTGTALMVLRDGTAQFFRCRRDLALFRYPGGEPGKIVLEPGRPSTIDISVLDEPGHLGYRATAYFGGNKVCTGAFSSNWHRDDNYFPGESKVFLVADSPVPPQSGFLAVISAPTRAVRIHKVVARGTVADRWLEQRTQSFRILKDFSTRIEMESTENEPASEEEKASPDAPEAAPPATPEAPAAPATPGDATSE
ncbi:MAG: hypothetical protein L6R28_07920 [Planctomycetes bacterium]|nr:hypothetical protein [Planctomycetota bacterium]